MQQWIIGLLVLLCSAQLMAMPSAPPRFDAMGATDGLPSSMVYTLAQDRDGFIWVGSADGLARYDGVEFRTWRHDPDDPGSLASNDVAALLIDSHGRLWCGGEAAGLSQMRADGSFRRYQHAADRADSLGSNDVWTIAEDAAGEVWIGTYSGGLHRLLGDDRFERHGHDADDPASLRSNNVLVLLGDPQGRLWIGTDVGLDVREPDGRIVHIDLPPFEGARGGLYVTSFLAEDDGSVLVGTLKGVARVGKDLRFIEEVAAEVPKANVLALVRDSEGALWIGAHTGLLRVDADGDARYGSVEPLPGELPGTRVMDILRDREGGLWFALLDGGIARLSAHWRNFSVWRHAPGVQASLLHNRVQGIDIDAANGIWISSGRDGVDHIDARGKITRHGARLGVRNELLRAVLAQQDVLWLGHQRGLRRYHLPSAGVVELPVDNADPNALPGGYLDQLRAGADGSIWAVARGGGVAHIDPDSLAIHRYTTAQQSLHDADISELVLDSQGRPWITSASGVERLNPSTDRFERLDGLPAGPVHALALIDDHSFWLHRLGALERYDVTDGRAQLRQRLAAAEGWPATSVGGMHLAADGSLWITSLRGLWRVDPEHGEIRHFGDRDGLPSSEFVLSAFAVDADGVVYAGTSAGLVAFDPARIRFDSLPPPVHVSALRLRRGTEELQLDPSQGLLLRHDDRDLSVQLRALSFLNPAANQYQFHLEGFDEGWVNADARGERVFSKLPAGGYLLQARGANALGAWSELDPPLQFRVAPPPWATPWAYAGYLLLAILLVWLLFRSWRERVERAHVLALHQEQRRHAENLAAAKSTFLATMSHEIRTPMTGVLGMTELLKRTDLDGRQRGYADAIERSGALMVRLVNDSLDLARIDAGKLALDAQPFDPAQLLRDVTAQQQPLALQKGLALTLEIAPDIPSALLGDSQRVQQILLNLSGNALKFTEQGSVILRAGRGAEGGLRLQVADTGLGIPESTRAHIFQRFEQLDGISGRFGGSGLGLAICRELTDLMGGHIEVESRIGAGSCFTVELPLPLASLANTPAAANPRGTMASLRVLVVENDPIVADVLLGLLTAAGHQALHAAHALGALGELKRGGIELVLIDLDLPGVDGLQLARMIRSRQGGGSLRFPLIAITARTGGDEAALAARAGMDGLMRKPVSGVDLDAVLAPWLSATRG